MRAASRGARRPAPAAGGPFARRAVTVAGVAFLAGIGFHTIVAGDRHGTSTRTPAATIAASSSRAGEPGPTRMVKGMPAGFADSEAGAVAAAATFVTTGQALIDLDPLSAEEAVRQMAAEATADRQVAQTLAELERLRDVLRDGTGRITIRQSAVAAHVELFEAGRARVAVWNVSVLTREGIAAPQAGWRISTFDLIWERSDWRIAAETINPGPAPLLDDSVAPATSAQLVSALEGFTPVGPWRFIEGGRG